MFVKNVRSVYAGMGGKKQKTTTNSYCMDSPSSMVVYVCLEFGSSTVDMHIYL